MRKLLLVPTAIDLEAEGSVEIRLTAPRLGVVRVVAIRVDGFTEIAGLEYLELSQVGAVEVFGLLELVVEVETRIGDAFVVEVSLAADRSFFLLGEVLSCTVFSFTESI